jgi:hypothetical protein
MYQSGKYKDNDTSLSIANRNRIFYRSRRLATRGESLPHQRRIAKKFVKHSNVSNIGKN